MGDPVSNSNVCRTPIPNYDAMMSEATGIPLREGVSLTHAPDAPGHDPSSTLAVGSTGLALDVAGEAVAGTLGFGLHLSGAGIAILETYASVFHALEDGVQDGLRYDHAGLRGALAVFEGRGDTLEVRAQANRDEAYASGVALAQKSLERIPAARVAEIARVVRAAGNAGISSVLRGQDRGPEFECRMSSDIVFRHGVEYARRLRERDSVAFEQRQALDNTVNDARRGQLRP